MKWCSSTLLVLLASACAIAPGHESTGATPSEPRAEPPEKVTLADFSGSPVVALIEEFSLSSPGIVVDLEAESPSSSYRPTLDDALADANADALADVVLFPADVLHLAAGSGAFDQIERIVIDPGAICFRQDLLDQAGLPSDPVAFADLLASNGGGWDQFFSVGRDYHNATGGAWFGDEALLWEAMAGQLVRPSDEGVGSSGAPAEGERESRRALLDQALDAGLGAGETWWDWRGGEALLDDSFAVTPCTPGLRDVMTGALGSADLGSARWAAANYFPGGNWSFSDVYAGLSADARMNDAAAELFTWLTEADGQAAIAEAHIGVPALDVARSHWQATAWIGSQDANELAAIDRNRANPALD